MLLVRFWLTNHIEQKAVRPTIIGPASWKETSKSTTDLYITSRYSLRIRNFAFRDEMRWYTPIKTSGQPTPNGQNPRSEDGESTTVVEKDGTVGHMNDTRNQINTFNSRATRTYPSGAVISILESGSPIIVKGSETCWASEEISLTVMV